MTFSAFNTVGFLYYPMPTQPLGWFSKKPVTGPDDLKNIKYRTVGLSADLFRSWAARSRSLRAVIVPALDRGLLDAAELQQPLVRHPVDVARSCMVQSNHQQAECFEIIFDKQKFDALPAEDEGDLPVCFLAATADQFALSTTATPRTWRRSGRAAWR